MDPERVERARQVMLDVDFGDDWLAAVDPDAPAWLQGWTRDWIDANARADMEWILEHTDPEIEIVQPPEFPDGRTYRGVDGMVEALLDWPKEWENFSLEPKRIYAVGDDAIMVAVHRGRSLRMQIEIEIEVVWRFQFNGERTRRWDMFLNVAAAERAALAGEQD